MVVVAASTNAASLCTVVPFGLSTSPWNVVDAVMAIGAGIVAGSVALIGFGADSAIEVISAVGLLWRLRKAGPHAPVSEESAAEKRALYVVAITSFLLAIYITWEAVKSLISQELPLTSPIGIILAVLSLAVMPTLAFVKQRVRTEMGSRALVADSKETWVCSYLSLTLLLGVGAYALLGWVVGRPCWCARDAPDHPLARMGDAN
jgi:divalent metal cation (Fe/Co/Zn/Cd) transporter